MYAEIEVHRTMICDRVRTDAFRRAINSAVRPGDIVLDVGAGSGILSMFAARAGAARVYAVERTTVAVLAQELAAANGVAEIVQLIHGDVMDVELPERVDVIVSEWLGGFGIDEGMLAPVIAARDRWLKPGGVMVPRSVTAWAALVHDRYLGETVEFLRGNPYGLRLEGLVEMTVNEISYSGTFRHLTAGDRRSEPGRLWTTDADLISLERAQAPHEAETLLQVRDHGTANALALWFSAELAPGISLSVGPGDPPTHWGMTTAPLRSPVELTPDTVVRARVRTAPARPARNMDEVGHRDAGRRLGGARRAVDLGGDRRLSSPRSPWRLPDTGVHRPRRRPDWSPDGRTIAFTRYPSASLRPRRLLPLCEVETGQHLAHEHDRWRQRRSPRCSSRPPGGGSRATGATCSLPSWIGSARVSRTASATARTPACATSRTTRSSTTGPGSSSR